MLRLWPEKLHVGLFGDHGWVRHGKAPVNALVVPAGTTSLGMLEAALDDCKGRISARTRVVLTVTDACAAVIAVPWHSQLSGQDELQRFAQLCFEQQGREVDATWAMHAAYRHYGAAGMAWALPRAWLAEVERLVLASGARLESVQPAAAVAYQRVRRQRGANLGLVLLRETRRCSVLRVDRHGLLGMDVESVTASQASAVIRLLRRTQTGGAVIAAVSDWQAHPASRDERDDIAALLDKELPGVPVSAIATEKLGDQ